MKAALLADRDWLEGELPALRRLVVGLVDEQVRVLRVVPDEVGVPADDALAITSTELRYPGSAWRWARDWSIRQLGDSLRDAEVDVLHVLDGSLCSPGMALSRQLNIPIICSVWSRQEIDQLATPPADPAAPPLVVTAPTQALTDHAARRLDATHADVEYVPAGVYRSTPATCPLPRPLYEPDQVLSAVVVGDGRLDPHYAALLEGMAQVGADLPHAIYFFHSVASEQHRLWQFAERLGLLEQVSLVPQGPDARKLLVQADVVIQPQPLGQVRTLVLEAMAAGRPVIAAADPMLDYLIDGETALLISNPTAARWTQLLTELVRRPVDHVRLGQGGREYVGEHHSAGRSIERHLAIYHHLTAKPLPFRA